MYEYVSSSTLNYKTVLKARIKIPVSKKKNKKKHLTWKKQHTETAFCLLKVTVSKKSVGSVTLFSYYYIYK